MSNLKELILAQDDRRYEDLYVPEWNLTVCIRSLTGEERERWQEGNRDMSDPRNPKIVTKDFEVRLVLVSMVDPETKERVFMDGDVAFLRAKNGAAINRCFTVAQRLSGIGEKEVEELTKNSSKGQSDDSVSD
jgi:hypothetical protein